MTTITACLIGNRGEIAVRIARACRELNIRAVAVYSDADARAYHVRVADDAVPIGAPPPRESYLNIAKLIDAARASACDAVHPGYGFLSENADFAQAVIDAGLIWVGPPPHAIRTMGSKTAARALMQRADVPLVPGFQSDDATDADFIAAAGDIGYPVMVKAAGGGGGKGIRVVDDPDALPDALAAARREAASAFNDARVFLEKYIQRGRHIEMQVVADAHGSIVHLFERECSAQRRHQKVIEESPSPLLTPDMRARMGAAAVEAARAVDYVNAGTVEFIAAPGGAFYFLEMNTRLQVEHPVTELVTGIDLVKLQFHIAAGGRLPFAQSDLTQRGHAIEARLYAENPAFDFAPSPGTLHTFVVSSAPGIRVDAGVQSGDLITPFYDPLIAKLIAYDATRDGAIQRLNVALRDAIIDGDADTNRDFLRALIAHPAFTAGEIDTTFIEREIERLNAQSDEFKRERAATETKPEQHTAAKKDEPVFIDPWARADGYRIGGGVTPSGGMASSAHKTPAARRAGGSAAGGAVTAPMPGQVRAVPVGIGETVKRGQTVIVLEAMKMEIKIAAPADGIVQSIAVSIGAVVERGQTLLVIDVSR